MEPEKEKKFDTQMKRDAPKVQKRQPKQIQ